MEDETIRNEVIGLIPKLKCQFEDDSGWCNGEYEGFRCIKHKCMLFGKTVVEDNVQNGCIHNTEGNYCAKYRKFFCPGEERCASATIVGR